MKNYIIEHRSKVQCRYYVYLHIRKSDNRIFYVGKGCGSRAWQTKGRSKYWNNITNKTEYEIKIVAHRLNESESLLLEKKLILFHRETICNLTSGGESPVFSKETLMKLSIARKGKKFSDQHKVNLGLSRKGKPRLEIIGDKNPNHDNSIYEFIRISDGLIFKGTRANLCSIHNIKPDLLRGLFLSKPRKSSQGWKLKGIL